VNRCLRGSFGQRRLVALGPETLDDPDLFVPPPWVATYWQLSGNRQAATKRRGDSAPADREGGSVRTSRAVLPRHFVNGRPPYNYGHPAILTIGQVLIS
jgi:hypothetical protein